MTSDGMAGIQSGIAGVRTEFGGIDYRPLVGIGETAAGVSAPLGEMRSSLNGITGQGIGVIQNDVSTLGSTLDTINSTPIAGIGEAAAGVSAPLDNMNEELVFAYTQNVFNDIGESWEQAIPYLAEQEERAVSDYLNAQNAFAGISESWENALPKFDRLGDALNGLKTDTITQAKAGFAEMTTAMQQINANPLNNVATQLSVMANMTQPMRDALAGMINEPSKLAGAFETSMKNIQAITGKSDAELNTLSADLLAKGSRIAAGPQAAADAYNDVAGGITKVSAQMPIFQNAIALAEAGQADLGVASNGLVKIMNAYNFTHGNQFSLIFKTDRIFSGSSRQSSITLEIGRLDAVLVL